MTLDPAHRRPELEDAERRRSEEFAREAHRVWRRERGRVKRRWMLPVLVVVVLLAFAPLWIVGESMRAPLVSVAATMASVAVAVALLRLPYESPIWSVGPVGEPRAGVWLAPLLDVGFIVLLDRALPPVVAGLAARPSRAVIDSLVVGPPGVFLVQPTRWRGAVAIQPARLVIGGADRTLAAEETRDKALAVGVVLDTGLPRRIPVAPVIGLAGRSMDTAVTTDGVRVIAGGELASWLLTQPAVLDAEAVAGIAGLADRRLPERDPWRAA